MVTDVKDWKNGLLSSFGDKQQVNTAVSVTQNKLVYKGNKDNKIKSVAMVTTI